MQCIIFSGKFSTFDHTTSPPLLYVKAECLEVNTTYYWVQDRLPPVHRMVLVLQMCISNFQVSLYPVRKFAMGAVTQNLVAGSKVVLGDQFWLLKPDPMTKTGLPKHISEPHTCRP